LPPRRPTLKKSLRGLARIFADIQVVLADVERRLRSAERAAGTKSSPQSRKLRITPKRRAQLKLQGAYMGYMRQLGPRQQARVRAVKEKKGFEAAIRVAKGMAARK
jgi:hypothetical protein